MNKKRNDTIENRRTQFKSCEICVERALYTEKNAMHRLRFEPGTTGIVSGLALIVFPNYKKCAELFF